MYHHEMTLSRQDDFLTKGRQHQKQRTREALLDAAVALARDGQSPSIADLAEAAMVSTATAYRYFPNPQSMWADLAIRQEPMDWVLEDLPSDAEGRVDAVVRRVAEVQFADETLWRGHARAALDRWFSQHDDAADDDERVPVRGSFRLEATRAALEPLEDRLPAEQFQRLTMAVTLVYGLDAMIASRDTCGLEADEATELMSWAARALVGAALAET